MHLNSQKPTTGVIVYFSVTLIEKTALHSPLPKVPCEVIKDIIFSRSITLVSCVTVTKPQNVQTFSRRVASSSFSRTLSNLHKHIWISSEKYSMSYHVGFEWEYSSYKSVHLGDFRRCHKEKLKMIRIQTRPMFVLRVGLLWFIFYINTVVSTVIHVSHTSIEFFTIKSTTPNWIWKCWTPDLILNTSHILSSHKPVKNPMRFLRPNTKAFVLLSCIYIQNVHKIHFPSPYSKFHFHQWWK